MIINEMEKYVKAWSYDEYRRYSPGEHIYYMWKILSNFKEGDSIISWGCGSGKEIVKMINDKLSIQAVDIAPNCLDPQIKGPLITSPIHLAKVNKAKYGYCVDVMEHIPEELTDSSLKNIFNNCSEAFFDISLSKDDWGSKLGIGELHMNIKPSDYWRDKMKAYGEIKFETVVKGYYCCYVVRK